MPEITSIIIYPIKSMGGITLNSRLTTDRGFAGDRRWMLIDDSGRFISQREEPRLALFRCELHDSFFRVEIEGESIDIPGAIDLGELLQSTIWSDSITTIEGNKELSNWFSNKLHRSCRLVFQPDASERKLNPAYATGNNSLSDGYPYLITTEESLADLNSRLAIPIGMDRFRPNVVIKGLDAYEEKVIPQLYTSNYRISLIKPCARCIVITTNQKTAIRSKEPLRTLAEYQLTDNKVIFGMNATIEPNKLLRVGDQLTTD